MANIDFMLDAIGFNDPMERLRLMEAGLADYDDYRHLVDKDIRDLAEDFSKRTIVNGRMIFGLGRTKKLVGLMHWIQDCFRTNDNPDLMAFNEQELTDAQSRAQVRKSDIELVDTNSKAADPGKFKDERKWHEWEQAFRNYLSVIPGVHGVPLSYVIRDEAVPPVGDHYVNFTERMVHRAPHTGPIYVADSRRVHNLITGFVQGELTESWIRPLARYHDGRRDMLALRHHYAGEGNSTRRIAEAKRIQTTLHYKSERALPFHKFLDSLQQMFTIYLEENEELTDRAKVDELLTKCQNPGLTAAVAQLRYQANTGHLTFEVAANHLTAAVSQTTDYLMARKISSTNTSQRDGGRGRPGGRGGGRYGNNGRGGRHNRGRGRGNYQKPKSGYYSPADWNKLSFEERDKIRKDRDSKGEQGGTKRNISDISVDQVTAIISALQKGTTSTDDDTRTTPPNNQAGNAFGGKEGARKRKNGE